MQAHDRALYAYMMPNATVPYSKYYYTLALFFLVDLTIHLSKMRHYDSRFQQGKVNPTFIYDYEDQTSICSYLTGT